MHKYIGGDLLVRGQGEQAMEHYNAALLSDRKRAEADPNNAQAQLDVTFDVRDMGSYYEDHGKLDVALENFHRAAEIRARLLQLDPANHTLQGRAVYIDLRLAGALLRTGNSVESLRYYRSAAKIAETRYAKDPDEVTNRGYLAFAYERVGFIQNVQATSATDGEKQRYGAQACASYRRSSEVLAPNFDLSRMAPLLSPEMKEQLIKTVKEQVARCSAVQ